ncbi:Si-specific NAD(P)(+) transhydrogenase [bacterium]|nr:Si-specific NAD(P)(+) transhydrogenase [bacterium]
MEPSHFDLIVIGSGPAGQRAAISAAKLGKKVALIERMRELGGVCVATGTIPSKTMREAVLHFSGMRQRAFYGASYRIKKDITAEDIRQRMRMVMEREWTVIRNQLTRNEVDVVPGTAKFKDAHTVTIAHNEIQELHADYFVIAVGTRPYIPPYLTHDGKVILNADSILEIPEIPNSMVCLGAGVIGLEYASIFAALEVEVTVVDSSKKLLKFVDQEIVESLIYQLRQMGVRFLLGDKETKVEVVNHKGQQLAHTLLASGKDIGSDVVLCSSGRQANGDTLDADKAGLTVDKRGRLLVDKFYRTNVKHIYACGDVVGFPALASTSMEQGRQAALHAFDAADASVIPDIYPFGIYTIPEISTVGATEEQLAQKGIQYKTGIARYSEIARGQILGDDTGILKIIVERGTRKLLGVHSIGTGASELIHIGQAVIAFNGTIDYLINAVFNYPTLAECYKTAALDAHNRLARVD